MCTNIVGGNLQIQLPLVQFWRNLKPFLFIATSENCGNCMKLSDAGHARNFSSWKHLTMHVWANMHQHQMMQWRQELISLLTQIQT